MCDNCEVLRINGVLCHEHGCPGAWMDDTRECPWCGSLFKPAYAEQRHCDDSCWRAYNGIEEEDDGWGGVTCGACGWQQHEHGECESCGNDTDC